MLKLGWFYEDSSFLEGEKAERVRSLTIFILTTLIARYFCEEARFMHSFYTAEFKIWKGGAF
ncbi:MAG: hypothetical protein V1655_02765 [bacterium]